MRFAVAAGFALLTSLVAGCGGQPTKDAGEVAKDHAAQLKAQQVAVRSVKVFDTMPIGSVALRRVMAGTCSLGTGANDDAAYVTVGLKLKAYQLGANGITNIEIAVLEDASGHCKYGAVGGTATALTVGG